MRRKLATMAQWYRGQFTLQVAFVALLTNIASAKSTQEMAMTYFSKFLAVLMLLTSTQTFAAGGGGGAPDTQMKPEDPVITGSKAAIAQKDWLRSQQILKTALASNPNNADYHNLYAFSVRKGPNPDMDLVFAQYQEALRIDPSHRGAHEYMGEAYLMVNDLPKAKEHLAALDRLCFFPCEEFSDLKEAVQKYEASHKP
jgi:tetratricopeptide (TPR) repeat protein